MTTFRKTVTATLAALTAEPDPIHADPATDTPERAGGCACGKTGGCGG